MNLFQQFKAVRLMTVCGLGMLCAFMPLFAAIEPAPGTIVTEEKTITEAWIEIETTDGVKFYLGDPNSPNRLEVNRKRDQYKEVVYSGTGEDPNFLRAEALYAAGDYTKAAESYEKSTKTAKWNWEIERAYRRAADCLLRINKGPDALALLKEYLEKYPKNIYMAEVVSLRAQLGLAAGKFAEAMADFKEMTKQAAAWSDDAERKGYLGQRMVLNAQKKTAEAITLLNGYWSRVKPTDDPDGFGEVGLALAEDYLTEGKDAEASKVLRAVYYAPIQTVIQSKAHLMHAEILAKANDTENNLAAFDHAALACLVGPDEETQLAAKKLARQLLSKIDKDKKLSDAVRKDYRTYGGSL